jgi:cytochrome c oxidase subunit 3
MLSGAISLVSYCHHHLVNNLSPVLIVFAVIYWWRDVIREAKGGDHTSRVQRGILIGFLLFLLSEIMLFVSLFWALFHSSLAPNVELAIWPPVGINAVDTWAIPLLGSSVLLASGFILTLGHHV